MLPPIFIIGCARSGTTILGRFFENNSQLHYCGEVDIWEKQEFFKPLKRERKSRKNFIDPLKRHNSLMIFLRTIHSKTSIFLQDIHLLKFDDGHMLTENDVTEVFKTNVKKIEMNLSKPRLVVKHPNNCLRIPFIKKLFPDAKFLHIVRDGRDVTCSLMGKHGKNYWAHIKPPGWQNWQKKYPSGPKKYAWQWNETISIVNQDKSNLNPEDFIEIKYEDLVFNPKEVMKKVFSNFEIPFEKPQEELCKKVDSDTHRELEATPGWTTNDHSSSIGRYKENLTPEELVEVEKILQKNNNYFNYPANK